MKIGDKIIVRRGKSANEIGEIIDMDNKGYANVKYLRSGNISTLKMSNIELYQEDTTEDDIQKMNVIMSDIVDKTIKLPRTTVYMPTEETEEGNLCSSDYYADKVLRNVSDKHEVVTDTDNIDYFENAKNAFKAMKKNCSFEKDLLFREYIISETDELLEYCRMIEEWKNK